MNKPKSKWPVEYWERVKLYQWFSDGEYKASIETDCGFPQKTITEVSSTDPSRSLSEALYAATLELRASLVGRIRRSVKGVRLVRRLSNSEYVHDIKFDGVNYVESWVYNDATDKYCINHLINLVAEKILEGEFTLAKFEEDIENGKETIHE